MTGRDLDEERELDAVGIWKLLLRRVDPSTHFGSVWYTIIYTIRICARYRIVGLAAEAAFFALLSLPPLLFAGVGAIGYVTAQISPHVIKNVRDQLLAGSSRVLTPDVVSSVIEPTIDEVLAGGRADVISIGFVIALWSGSRALNVFIATVAIMYGHPDHRDPVLRRIIAFAVYLIIMVVAVVMVPLILAGPNLVQQILPDRLDGLGSLYWPIVLVGTTFFLAALYDISLPRGYRLRDALPGAGLALLSWVIGSVVLRWALSVSGNSTSIFGPLSAPIALLLWLYLVSIAVLVGAALNAEILQVKRLRASSIRAAEAADDEPPLPGI